MKNFVLGVEMTEKELQGAFERNGLKKHRRRPRARSSTRTSTRRWSRRAGTDVAPGGVVEVMQPGYELLGRLVRPAMVVVAAKGAGAAPAADAEAPGKANGAGQNPYAAGDEADPGGSVDKRA